MPACVRPTRRRCPATITTPSLGTRRWTLCGPAGGGGGSAVVAGRAPLMSRISLTEDGFESVLSKILPAKAWTSPTSNRNVTRVPATPVPNASSRPRTTTMPSRSAVRSISTALDPPLERLSGGVDPAGSGRPTRTPRSDSRSRSALVTLDGTVLINSSASRMWMLVRWIHSVHRQSGVVLSDPELLQTRDHHDARRGGTRASISIGRGPLATFGGAIRRMGLAGSSGWPISTAG